MAKITVCDVCKNKGRLIETRKHMSVKGIKTLRIDFCEECRNEIPKNITEYIKFVYRIKYNMNIDDKFVDTILVRR